MSLFKYLLGGLLLATSVAAARPPAPPHRDSVKGRPAIPRLARSRFVAQYDSRYSIINHHFTTINGLKLGIEFKNRFRTGAAIYFLSTGVPTRQAKPENAAEDADAQLRFPLPGRVCRLRAGRKPALGIEHHYADGTRLGVRALRKRRRRPRQNPPRLHGRGRAHARGPVPGVSVVAAWAPGWAGGSRCSCPASIQKELNGPVFYLRANLISGRTIQG